MIPALLPHLTVSDFLVFINFFQKPDSLFKKKLQQQFKTKHSFTFSSGRAGIYHILKANKIKNKNILVSAYTCCVVTEAIVQSNNTPVFVDVNKDSFNAQITQSLIKKHQSNLGAVIITNLYGLVNFSDPFFLKKNKKILVILDDALSPYHIKHKPTGLYDYMLISCSARKPFSCLGGGIIFTDKQDKVETLKNYLSKNKLKSNSIKKFKKFILNCLLFLAFQPLIYPFTCLMKRKTWLLQSFFNEKNHDIYKPKPEYFEPMYDFQKRLGINQLKKFNWLTKRRKQIGNQYYRLLKPHFPFIKNYWQLNTSYSHIPFLHPQRDKLADHLAKNRIDTEKYFDYSIPQLIQYKTKGKFLRAQYLANRIINLPIYPGLTEKTIAKIVRKIKIFSLTAFHLVIVGLVLIRQIIVIII